MNDYHVSDYQVVDAVDDKRYADRLRDDAKKKEKGIYSRTIFVGLGGTGAKALQHLRRMILERFGTVDALEGIAFLSIDTDVRSQDVSADEKQKNPLGEALSFERDERVNVKVDFKSYLGPNIIHYPHIREWWDEAALPSDTFNMETGTGQIRPLSRLAFFTNRADIEDGINRAYRKVTSQRVDSSRVDTHGRVRVVVVTGLAGGTGSGMFLDLAALIQSTLVHHQRPYLEGFFVLPGGFSTVEQTENYPKLAANGFASLKELNHYLSHPFEVRWEAGADLVRIRGPYDRYVLFSGTNASGEHLDNLADCYRAVGEILFLDFGAGPMAGWVQGVRINREQYLRSAVTYTYRLPKLDGNVEETHAEKWLNIFASVGISKLVFPTWRLINKAKYQLAGQMVSLMDPGRLGRLDDVITRHRDHFLFDCGFLQGELETDDGRQMHWQIRDRLAKQTGIGKDVSSVYDHLRRFQHELLDLAESMYTEKNSPEVGEELWKRVSGLWGEPGSRGNEGDWVLRIRENRKTMVEEVRAVVPEVVEDFRCKPAVGISGLVALLTNILELIDRPADQARYSDWFRQRRVRLANDASTQFELWKKRLKNADRASRGFGASVETHQEAVRMASESFFEYWRAKVNDCICVEGEKALEEIRNILRQQLGEVETISEQMLRLESEYRHLAEFYASRQSSFIVHEIEIPPDLGDLLEPYLGATREIREERLQRLLDKGLRQMGLNTLREIRDKLSGEFEQFRDNLAAQAFYALRGEHGRTAAFAENPDDSIPAFIERYSIFSILKEKYNEGQRRELYDQLYRKGLPWGQKNQAEALVDLHKPHGDAFIGIIPGGQEEIANELEQYLAKVAETRFKPQRVQAYDPSEIIFYTELTAYPVYYLSEITGLKKEYDSLVARSGGRTPLHLHQDYHQFQPIMPFTTEQVARYQSSWRLFIHGLMLGLIRSVRLRMGDDKRVSFQWRREAGPFEVQWMDLGAEGQLIQRLMSDTGLTRQLQQAVEKSQAAFLRTGRGDWSYLVALADYYYYCIFPLRGTRVKTGEQAKSVSWSMQNLVCSELRKEWRKEVEQAATADETFNLRIKDHLGTLATWSCPVYRDRGQVVPTSEPLPDTERVDEWILLAAVTEQIRNLVSDGLIPQSRDAQGNLIQEFPRLAVDWKYFDRDQPPDRSGAAPSRWFYKGAGPQEQGLTAADVAARMEQDPHVRHRVWTPGMDDWCDALEVPAIAELAAPDPRKPPSDAELPPPDAELPPPDAELPPPDAELPPPDAELLRADRPATPEVTADEPPPLPPPAPESAGPIFHYACDDQRLGSLSAGEIAERIAARPESSHKVWTKSFGRQWKPAFEVPEITALLPEEPPPLE